MKFESLLHVSVERQRQRIELTLRMPSLSDVFALWLPRRLRTTERMAVMGPAEVKRCVQAIDGEAMNIERARALFADRSLFVQYIGARNRLLETVIESGMLFASCPHCDRWEADLAPLAIAVGLRTAFWPVSEDDGFLAAPALAEHTARGARPRDIRPASQLIATLPYASALQGTTVKARFHRGDVSERERQIAVEVSARQAQEGHEQWRDDVVGFRAIVRLAARLDVGGDATPESVQNLMQLPLADFMCLDNLHYLLHDRSVPDDHGLTIECHACGQPFLPLL